jgi:hypothetical protein
MQSAARAALLLALLAAPASSQTRFAPTSPAPPASTVLWGSARFSFLSDTLIRLELASPSTGAFDDRPSLAIVNRSALPPPALDISTAGAALTVRTAALTLRYAPPGGNSSGGGGGGGNHSICALAQGADVTGAFSRVPDFPLGAIVADLAACCSLCDGSAQCNAFVFAPHPRGGADPAGTNCWVLMGVSALVPSSSRIAALRQSGFGSALSVTFQVQGQASATVWNASMTSATDGGQLRGVWHALDCYDVPEVCTASYNSSLAPGLLSRSGWALLDDTDAARLVPAAPGVPSPIPYGTPTPLPASPAPTCTSLQQGWTMKRRCASTPPWAAPCPWRPGACTGCGGATGRPSRRQSSPLTSWGATQTTACRWTT